MSTRNQAREKWVSRVEQVDVVAVVGSCASERAVFSMQLAAATHRMLVPAARLAVSPDPVDEALSIAPWVNAPAGALMEFATSASMTDLIGSLADESAPTALVGVVCVVDASHLIEDLWRDTYLSRIVGVEAGVAMTDDVAEALVTATQIEFASHVVLVNWSTLQTHDLSTVMAVLSHLAPRARLRLQRRIMEPWTDRVAFTRGQDSPGWIGVINGRFDPHMTDPRVSAFRYENVRPFHPGRLEVLLNERIEPGEFGRVLRSSGFCRFATRPYWAARWEHVGRMVSFPPMPDQDAADPEDETLAFGQELAIIGLDLDRDRLVEALDSVALTDDELVAGPQVWSSFRDPFPAWPAIADRAE